MTGNMDTINTKTPNLEADRLIRRCHYISLEDSVFNTITIKEAIPEKAWGYMGKDTINESQEIDFGDFSDFSGQFDLEHIEVKLLTENSIGASRCMY